MNNTTNSKPGAESKVTVELIYRVSELVAKGISIRLALQGESVTFDAYKKHLQRHPELRAIHAAAKIKFLNLAIDMITSKNGPMLRWFLERRHSRDFSPNQEDDAILDSETTSAPQPENRNQTIKAAPEADLDEARKQPVQSPISNCPLHFARLHDLKGFHAKTEKKLRWMGGQFPGRGWARCSRAAQTSEEASLFFLAATGCKSHFADMNFPKFWALGTADIIQLHDEATRLGLNLPLA